MNKQIKERGIIFNGEMVRAILDGRKTQTRRVMKVQPVLNGSFYEVFGAGWSEGIRSVPAVAGHSLSANCPFGQVGDRLWVRETCYATKSTPHGIRAVAYPADNEIKIIEYADQHIEKWGTLFHYRNGDGQKVPSIHMPRWASRITLEITDIRVERLKDISEKDAESEGIHIEVWDQTVVARNYLDEDAYFQFWSEDMPDYIEDMRELFRRSFRSLWESIHGRDSWQSNPWVWVVEFKRVEAA